jgi:DNA-binding MarR family transcriptional regulator
MSRPSSPIDDPEGEPEAGLAPAAPTVLVPELSAELPVFEQFFKTFGFKRLHGRVWGLLVLCDHPLSSKEISEQLGISQGATSTTLHELTEWGAIQSTFDSARRCHLHGPVGNALSIAATILRRREQVAFQQFRVTADRALEFIKLRHGERDPRVLTLRSIIAACEIAEALMKLLVSAVANALGDSQSILSRAITAALKVGLGAPQSLFAQAGGRNGLPAPKGKVRKNRQAAAGVPSQKAPEIGLDSALQDPTASGEEAASRP